MWNEKWHVLPHITLKPETCHAWNPGIKGRSCSNSGVSRKRHLPAAPRHMEPQHPQSSHVTEWRNCNIMQLDLPKGLRTCSKKTNLIESIIWTYSYSSLMFLNYTTTGLSMLADGTIASNQKMDPVIVPKIHDWYHRTQYDTIFFGNYSIEFIIIYL